MKQKKLTCWTPVMSARSSVGFHRPRSLVATEWVCRGRLLRRPPDEEEGLLALRRDCRFSGSTSGVITDGNVTTLLDDPSSAKHCHNKSRNIILWIKIQQITKTKSITFWYMILCSSVETHCNFRGLNYLHLQVQSIKHASNLQEADNKNSDSSWLLAWLMFWPGKWRKYILPKCQ